MLLPVLRVVVLVLLLLVVVECLAQLGLLQVRHCLMMVRLLHGVVGVRHRSRIGAAVARDASAPVRRIAGAGGRAVSGSPVRAVSGSPVREVLWLALDGAPTMRALVPGEGRACCAAEGGGSR